MEYYLPETFTSNCCLGTPLQANDICEEDDDICDDKLTCYRCEENVDAVCLSGNDYIFLLVDLFLG